MIKYDELIKFWPKYEGKLADLFAFMDNGSESDAWKMAALVLLRTKGKTTPVIRNAQCVSIAKFLHIRDRFPLKYETDTRPFSFIDNGKLVDTELKKKLSFDFSVPAMYAKTTDTVLFHLPLGSAVIQKEDIFTLVDVGYNRDDGWAVLLHKDVILIGDVPGDIPWTSYPHRTITQEDLLGDGAWLGRLVYST